MRGYVYTLAICAAALLLAAPALADVINLNFVSVATGVDDGPRIHACKDVAQQIQRRQDYA